MMPLVDAMDESGKTLTERIAAKLMESKRKFYRTGDQLRNALLDPLFTWLDERKFSSEGLTGTAEMSEVTSIVIGVEGNLAQIPWAALPTGAKLNSSLLLHEKYAISNVICGAELAHYHPRPQMKRKKDVERHVAFTAAFKGNVGAGAGSGGKDGGAKNPLSAA